VVLKGGRRGSWRNKPKESNTPRGKPHPKKILERNKSHLAGQKAKERKIINRGKGAGKKIEHQKLKETVCLGKRSSRSESWGQVGLGLLRHRRKDKQSLKTTSGGGKEGGDENREREKRALFTRGERTVKKKESVPASIN